MEVRAGDVAEILSAYTSQSSNDPVAITINGTELRPRSLMTSFNGAAVPTISAWTIAGPATIRAAISNTPDLYQPTMSFVTVSVKRFDEAPAAQPAGAVVIPEDAAGQYRVILESSTDLITWTVANPGIYGGSTTSRFFRTRIVKQ